MECLEKRIDGETKYKGVIVNVYLDKVRLCDGTVARREVVEHPGGVSILPVDGDDVCYMVRQFRYPAGRIMLETPAGKLEYGEDHRECAERELSEETGLSCDELIYLGGCYTSPGFSTEMLHFYLALGLHEGECHLDVGEFLNVEKFSLEHLLDMISAGEIEDAKTIVSVLRAEKYLKERRSKG